VAPKFSSPGHRSLAGQRSITDDTSQRFNHVWSEGTSVDPKQADTNGYFNNQSSEPYQ
jgi:hypothetical protein